MTELIVKPLEKNFGCSILLPSYAHNDPSLLNEADFKALHDAVLTYLVVIIPNQEQLSPKSQYYLTHRFDDTLGPLESGSGASYGHGKEFRHDNSVLKKDGCSVKSQPQVQIIGQGKFAVGEAGNENEEELNLTHPSHTTFHKEPLSSEQIQQKHQTRFYRWHIDSALYGLSPPKVTTLLGIKVPPSTHMQTIDYDDGSGETLELLQGATCFVSGREAFDIMSDDDKQFALNTTVEYAPHPYIFISPAKATKDGLTMVSEGKETPLTQLPEWEEAKIKRLPMVWTNPVTGHHHLQVHGCCIRRLHTKVGDKVITMDLEEARKKVHSLMRPAISPERVLAHGWSQGDLVIFYNRGVWHSVTGELKGMNDGVDEKRLMHQCNIASGKDPITAF